MNKIAFTARLTIADCEMNKSKESKYSLLSNMFEDNTRNLDLDKVKWVRIGGDYGYDVFEFEDKNNNKDVMRINGLNENMTIYELLDKIIDVCKVASRRIGYNILLEQKDEQIAKLKKDKLQIESTKQLISRVYMPSDITYSEFYTQI